MSDPATRAVVQPKAGFGGNLHGDFDSVDSRNQIVGIRSLAEETATVGEDPTVEEPIVRAATFHGADATDSVNCPTLI